MSRDPRLDASCDLYAYDLCDGSETCACMDEPEVCCCCKDPAARVTYHNYREQPFCWPCADAKCAHEEPEGDHPNGFLCRRHGVDDCFCSGTPDCELVYDPPCRSIEPQQKETRVPKIGIDEGMAKFGVAWHVDKSKTFTTVILTGERYVGLGTAKRNPVDTYDRQTGFDIAMSRALHELADQVERGAHA